MITLGIMKLQDCEMFVSRWLKTGDLVHVDHFALILSELGIGGVLNIVGPALSPAAAKNLINAWREGDLFSINDIITDAVGSDYMLYKSGNYSWQLIND